MKILLLEDTLLLNKAIKQILEHDDHNVLSFINGRDALESIHESIDLYLLDITVPGINGLELLKRIKNYNPTAKIIIMSADTSIDSITDAYNNGCLDFLKKPFHTDELRLKISRLVSEQKELYSSVEFKDSIDINNTTNKERKLLTLLLENKNNVVDMDMIQDYVYGESSMTTDALRSLIKRLRSKLQNNDTIKTMPYQGYMYMDL